MTSSRFRNIAKKTVCKYANDHLDKSDGLSGITTDDVYVVWFCKVLQNLKCLLSTTIPDGMYYEVTYNGDNKEMYFDAYKKFENRAISMEE